MLSQPTFEVLDDLTADLFVFDHAVNKLIRLGLELRFEHDEIVSASWDEFLCLSEDLGKADEADVGKDGIDLAEI